MRDKSDPSFQKARDEALRVLVQRGKLTPDQVSGLKLNQVHLATSTLVIEPDEFSSTGEATIRLKLDDAMQRALIAWLVVRPDGPNDHLFPGAGTAGLDVASINQVVAAEQPAPASKPEKTRDVAAPPGADSGKPETLPESVTPGPHTADKDEGPVIPPPPVTAPRDESEAVTLDEIETLRQRLAQTYDAWAPAVAASAVHRPESSPAPPAEVETAPYEADSRAPSETVITPPLKDEVIPGASPVPVEREPAPGMPPPSPHKTGVVEPVLEPPEETPVRAPAPAPSPSTGQGLRGFWEQSEEKATLNLSYRTLAIGGLALLLVICCVGLSVAGGTMLGSGGGGLLAGATPTETHTPTPIPPSATSTSPPSPPSTVIQPTSTPIPTDAPTLAAAPTSTQGPTPTPVVIVVTATPTPEPPPTDTPVPTDTPEGGVTDAPEGGAAPEPTATQVPGFKYPAVELVWPQNGSTVPGEINILQWEPVGPLDDDEWYAVRLVYRQQGELAYAGDRVKVPEWRVPIRLYYAADGPDLEYEWYVFVERENADGSAAQLSPESQRFVFRWE